MTPATASGTNMKAAKTFHAFHASRQLPAVMPSTNSGTTSVQQKMQNSSKGRVFTDA